ncbi:dynein regulatory complex subunit 2 isoform X2 [Scophthalmus maximus]|uniref:dynein regulatory complex subunit 2 isoform X2 n=1 Tax=Scophthalmus maximus TaxID=52904 RepID=UPI001FA8FBAA|nr:dynein regulatory complex subunit 2 isoform X2 [Scophthalmus maximus]
MTKKVKKGGGGKGGGKTEEEKGLYLQQRAQAEDEMAKKKEEILTLFLKDKLQKEEKNSAVNLLKLNEGWRTILRQTQPAELRKDAVVLRQTFEKQLDGMDDVIKLLEGDLRDTERQSAQVRRVHLQHVERLWAQQEKRLTFLQEHWEKNLQHLSSGFHSERKQMLEHSRQQQSYLEHSSFTVEQQHKEVMDEIHKLYSESMASYQRAHEDRVHHRTSSALVREGDTALKDKTRQHQETQQLHRREAKDLDDLIVKNQQYIQMTEESRKKVKGLQDKVFQLRWKLNTSKAENESMERNLTAASNEVNQKAHKIQDQLTWDHAGTRKQLVNLTLQSNDATKKLQVVIAKGERDLRIAEMCCKLERKLENVFTSSPLAEDDHRSVTEEEAEKVG